MELFAPPSYIEANEVERAAVCNGCGPGGWKLDLVPDTLWGLSVKEACNIHDWMYDRGVIEEDREQADRVLLNNMMRIIDEKTWWRWLRRLRRHRARVYYRAVKHFGGPSFWKDKNDPGELLSVEI